MFDIDVLSILNNKDKYERFSPYVKKHLLSPEAFTIFNDMGKWFAKHDELEWPAFNTWFNIVQHSDQTNAQKALNDLVFKKLDGHVVNAALEKELTENLIGKDYATKIADIALAITEGDAKHSMKDVIDLVEKYDIELDRSADYDSFLVTSDIHELIASTSAKTGYEWAIDQLNQALGPVRKGDFIVVTSRPDSGKTTFLLHNSTHIMSQLPEDENVYWFNNEEGGPKVKKRAVSSGIGWTNDEIDTDPLGALEKFNSTIGDLSRFKFYDKNTIDVHTIKTILKKGKPGLIIFDQLRKVHGFSKEAVSDVHRQELLYNWAREIAKEFAPVITVHQAGGTMGGEKWIPMEAMYGSQTAIQGEADAIIAIGRTYDPTEQDFRFFNLPKNKMTGTNPAVRNGRFILKINPDIARFESDGLFDT